MLRADSLLKGKPCATDPSPKRTRRFSRLEEPADGCAVSMRDSPHGLRNLSQAPTAFTSKSPIQILTGSGTLSLLTESSCDVFCSLPSMLVRPESFADCFEHALHCRIGIEIDQLTTQAFRFK